MRGRYTDAPQLDGGLTHLTESGCFELNRIPVHDDDDMRYRLDVIAASVLDVVEAAGGLLFDRRMAGWDVTVLVPEGEDVRAHRSSESTSCRWGRPGSLGRSAGMCRRWRSRQTCSTVTRGSNRACCKRSSRVFPKSSCGVVIGHRNWCAAATNDVTNSAERHECSSLMPPWLRRARSLLLLAIRAIPLRDDRFTITVGA